MTVGVLVAAAVARAGLLALASWQDAHLEVPFTDIDYGVYTDAAAHVLAGGSPFDRATYRYSPLLAWALTPNLTLHGAWGKVLFCAADLAAAWLMLRVLRARSVPPRRALAGVAAAWLFNPYTATISARGSCDSLSSAVMLGVVALLVERREAPAGLLYGLAVHFRVFPVIYAPALWLFLGSRDPAAPRLARLLAFHPRQLVFTAAALACFAALTAACYWRYGEPYLEEAFLHHVRRADPEHNFSPWFYAIRLLRGSDRAAAAAGLAAFVPQTLGWALAAWALAPDLPLALTLQTMLFVALNKVITAQYFAWYFALWPLCLPAVEAGRGPQLARAAAVWVVAQVHWLGWAYLLEFRELPVVQAVFAASCVFLAAHLALARAFKRAVPLWPVFARSGDLVPWKSPRTTD